MENEQWIETARQILIRDEGLRLRPYKDTKGFWTYGVGRFIGRELTELSITKATALQMLDEDIQSAWNDMCFIFGEHVISTWSPARQHAVHNLLFNMGRDTFLNFKRTIEAITSSDWDKATDELMDSLWFTQVGERSIRICHMVKTGEYYATDMG